MAFLLDFDFIYYYNDDVLDVDIYEDDNDLFSGVV